MKNDLKKKSELLSVVYSDKKYYIIRNDCPGDPPKEITLGGIIDLMKNVQRYESDGWNEKHKV